jgi:hypothetical protein
MAHSQNSLGCPGQRGSHGDLTLPSAAVRVPAGQRGTGCPGCGTDGIAALLGRPAPGRWGGYAAAVARWEVLLGRAVPAPTQPGRHGRPVLAPPFVEWLMGLDAGWVTDLDLPRTGALRVLGNAVVWQQAAFALRILLCPHRWERR